MPYDITFSINGEVNDIVAQALKGKGPLAKTVASIEKNVVNSILKHDIETMSATAVNDFVKKELLRERDEWRAKIAAEMAVMTKTPNGTYSSANSNTSGGSGHSYGGTVHTGTVTVGGGGGGLVGGTSVLQPGKTYTFPNSGGAGGAGGVIGEPGEPYVAGGGGSGAYIPIPQASEIQRLEQLRLDAELRYQQALQEQDRLARELAARAEQQRKPTNTPALPASERKLALGGLV